MAGYMLRFNDYSYWYRDIFGVLGHLRMLETTFRERAKGGRHITDEDREMMKQKIKIEKDEDATTIYQWDGERISLSQDEGISFDDDFVRKEAVRWVEGHPSSNKPIEVYFEAYRRALKEVARRMDDPSIYPVLLRTRFHLV